MLLNINNDTLVYILSFLNECNTFLQSITIRHYSELFNLRKMYFKLKLNNEYSLKYYENIEYRTYINNNYKLIFINLNENSMINDVSSLGNFHTLNLESCSEITDVSALGNVYTLDLRGCRKITNVSMLKSNNLFI